ncbi:hypothetical protein D9M69_605700 [compost metagenome]
MRQWRAIVAVGDHHQRETPGRQGRVFTRFHLVDIDSAAARPALCGVESQRAQRLALVQGIGQRQPVHAHRRGAECRQRSE